MEEIVWNPFATNEPNELQPIDNQPVEKAGCCSTLVKVALGVLAIGSGVVAAGSFAAAVLALAGIITLSMPVIVTLLAVGAAATVTGIGLAILLCRWNSSSLKVDDPSSHQFVQEQIQQENPISPSSEACLVRSQELLLPQGPVKEEVVKTIAGRLICELLARAGSCVFYEGIMKMTSHSLLGPMIGTLEEGREALMTLARENRCVAFEVLTSSDPSRVGRVVIHSLFWGQIGSFDLLRPHLRAGDTVILYTQETAERYFERKNDHLNPFC
jgi:hypothetical protein